MINNQIFETNIQIIINKYLYENKLIDELTFIRVEELLLKKLTTLKERSIYEI